MSSRNNKAMTRINPLFIVHTSSAATRRKRILSSESPIRLSLLILREYAATFCENDVNDWHAYYHKVRVNYCEINIKIEKQ